MASKGFATIDDSNDKVPTEQLGGAGASAATFLRGDQTWQEPPGAAGLPSGIICMWSGTIATIPGGWALCDGAGGRPDLRDKFIVGATQDDAGVAKTNVTGSLTQTGGATTHSHAGHADHVVTQPAGHNDHAVTQPADHAALAHAGAAVADHAAKNTAQADVGATQRGTTASTLTLKAHLHSVGAYVHAVTQASDHAAQAHAGTAVNAHSAHAGSAIDSHSAHDSRSHLNPYYALAFIIKL